MALTERITRNVEARYWYPEEDSFPVKNRYTAGVAGQKFFQELRDHGRIYGTRCSSCGLTYVPARLFCERCLERLEEWVEVGTRGTVFAHTTAYVDKKGDPREEPVVLVAVKLGDGVLLHRLGEFSPEQVRNGVEVEAVLRPQKERRGSIMDIRYFKPV